MVAARFKPCPDDREALVMPAAHNMDNLPELAEADSPPHIRQIYSEIRHWTGGPIEIGRAHV